MRLCEACARERGIIGGQNGLDESAAWFLHGLFEGAPKTPGVTRGCPVCGSRLKDIRNSRQAGCGVCYETFPSEIKKILQIPESGKSYRGKLPRRVLSYKRFFIDRENLKIQLESALGSEDYEKAAELRDKIHKLDSAGSVL
jgi:protein arginine kinase activator